MIHVCVYVLTFSNTVDYLLPPRHTTQPMVELCTPAHGGQLTSLPLPTAGCAEGRTILLPNPEAFDHATRFDAYKHIVTNLKSSVMFMGPFNRPRGGCTWPSGGLDIGSLPNGSVALMGQDAATLSALLHDALLVNPTAL